MQIYSYGYTQLWWILKLALCIKFLTDNIDYDLDLDNHDSQ